MWLKVVDLTLYILKKFRKQYDVNVMFIISWHWNGAGHWNPSSWKSRTSLSYIVNTMPVDALAWSQGINRHGIDLVLLGSSSLSSRRGYILQAHRCYRSELALQCWIWIHAVHGFCCCHHHDIKLPSPYDIDCDDIDCDDIDSCREVGYCLQACATPSKILLPLLNSCCPPLRLSCPSHTPT